jgi:hypothetical protein
LLRAKIEPQRLEPNRRNGSNAVPCWLPHSQACGARPSERSLAWAEQVAEVRKTLFRG